MKSAIAFCVVFFAAVALARPGGDTYTDKYDNINLDEILPNAKLLNSYVNCMLDLGRCTAEGKELKSHVQEALETNCLKCTPMQKDGTRRVIKHMINKEPAYWKALNEKYDPQGKYTAKYEKELREVKA